MSRVIALAPLLVVLAQALTPATGHGQTPGKPPAPAAKGQSCVAKAGEATGITRGFAEYEALLIIRQVTGNWPIEQDRIGPPSYRCKQEAVGWSCRAQAVVCRR